MLAQGGTDDVQPGETLEVRVGPGHTTPRRSNYRAAPSSRPTSDTLVEETGTVKWFNAERGYGFIARNGGGEDVFVHISAFERSGLTGLNEGDRVIVDISEGRKGLEAARVRLI